MVTKNYQRYKAIQFKDAVRKGRIICMKQFLQYLKNDVIIMIVIMRIHQEKK